MRRLAARGIVFAALVTVGAPVRAATDWARAHLITITASEYQFSPAHLVLRHGAAYHLHLKNTGKELHEFHSDEFFKAATLRDPGVLNADKNEVVIQPGQEKDVYFIAPAAGRYAVYCPDHDWAGMTGDITVK